LLLLLAIAVSPTSAYHRSPCTRQAAADFSFDDCYLPAMSDSLALEEASFLMAHDAATGYMQKNSWSTDALTWSYTQTQVGSLYQQLDDGARALDLRPKLWRNGTVVFHHGAITVPVNFRTALEDVVRWCAAHPTEIVLILTSHYSFGKAAHTTDNDDDMVDDDDDASSYYQGNQKSAMVSALQSIYDDHGVRYVSCSDVYGWTVATLMENAALANGGGILLALDGQNYYGGASCAKENYVSSQVVTCWTNHTSCQKSSLPYELLQDYILASANNDATDDTHTLGPPANLYRYPLNEIQALWQVSTQSAATGVAHFSSILRDNTASQLHVHLVDLIHRETMPGSLGLVAVDNVALHGNAVRTWWVTYGRGGGCCGVGPPFFLPCPPPLTGLLCVSRARPKLTSVLRNRCGQSVLTDTPCGPDLAPPRLHDWWHVEARVVLSFLLALYVTILTVVFFWKRPHLLQVMGDEVRAGSAAAVGMMTATRRGDASKKEGLLPPAAIQQGVLT
jgi:hypothetical protein